jgi:hypothetical protein
MLRMRKREREGVREIKNLEKMKVRERERVKGNINRGERQVRQSNFGMAMRREKLIERKIDGVTLQGKCERRGRGKTKCTWERSNAEKD